MTSTFRGSLSRVMNRLPVGECRSCGAEISYFTRRCLHCGAANLPNPVATVAALVAVLLIGGLIALGVVAFHSAGSPKTTAQTTAQTAAPATGATLDEADGDYGWIVKAMAECEEEAKLKTDTLHFLIVPVTTTATTIMGWSPVPISPIGESAVLLNSTDTLIGLRNDVLAIYRKPLTFAVSDPATQTTYKWRPAVGRDRAEDARDRLDQPDARIRDPRRVEGRRMGPDHQPRQGILLLDQPAGSSARPRRLIKCTHVVGWRNGACRGPSCGKTAVRRCPRVRSRERPREQRRLRARWTW